MGSDLLTILQGDALEKLRELSSESLQCCVCSPPFWGLRDYNTAKWEGGDEECDHRHPNERRLLPHGDGRKYDCYAEGRKTSAGAGAMFKEICGRCGAKRIDAQLGLEKTPEEYVAKMVGVFREVRRVLRNDGTLWLNLGDSYANDTKWGGATGGKHVNGLHGEPIGRTRRFTGLKGKDLVGIPWMVAFALRADGWWLRSDIIWNKANCMPESVLDRPTRSHEYLFLLTKSGRYFYDAEAIKEPASEADWESRIGRANLNNKLLPTEEINGIRPRVKYTPNAKTKHDIEDNHHGQNQRRFEAGPFSNDKKLRGHPRIHEGNLDEGTKSEQYSGMRNKRDVWTIAPANYPEAHFATYPADLIKPCILAGTRVGDTVLDPFAGSGTTGMVAIELGRKAILIELNPDYVELIKQRCNVTPGLALG